MGACLVTRNNFFHPVWSFALPQPSITMLHLTTGTETMEPATRSQKPLSGRAKMNLASFQLFSSGTLSPQQKGHWHKFSKGVNHS